MNRFPKGGGNKTGVPRSMQFASPRCRRGARAALASVCLAALFALGCAERKSDSIQIKLGEKVYGSAIPIETLELRRTDFEDSIPVPGLIEAEEEVTISAEIAARIVKIDYDVGDEIEVGDLLVALDDAEIQARMKQIKAQIGRVETLLATARKDLKRHEALFQSEVSAERTLDDAQSLVATYGHELRSNQAELEMGMVDLARTRIRSPVKGTVAEKHVAIGEYVTPGTQLFDLVMIDRVNLVFSLTERDIGKVHSGDRLRARLDAFNEKSFDGSIHAISPRANPRTRTYRVELGISNPSPHPLMPGMSGRVRIVRRRFENVFLVPEEAILRDGDRSFVYLAKNDAQVGEGEGQYKIQTAEQADVRILGAVGAKAVISADLGGEFNCIIMGQYAVQPGSSVRVRRVHQVIPEIEFD